MSKAVTAIVGAVEIGVGIATANAGLIAQGVLTEASLLLAPSMKARQAQATTMQIGEVPRSGVFGTGAVAGSLADAFNFGGKYGTDWTLLVIPVADHRCEALEGFYVKGQYVAFTGDGVVPGFNGQLQVFWRPGAWDDDVPAILTANCPVFPAGHPKAGQKTWTENDRGRGVAKVIVAYKADKATAKHPVWASGLPTFTWVVKGVRCYIGRKDDTIGGSGAHRWDDPSTREWSDNPIDCRYTWVRGLYAGDKVDQPEMLLLGRGLSAIEAPPENSFAPSLVCDELVPLKGVLASLNEEVEKHDTTLSLNTVAGLSAGMSIAINEEGGFTETATVQSISGSDVTLTGGLKYDHPAFTAVSWATNDNDPVTEPRYRIGGAFGGDDAYIDTETDIAAACGGWLVERGGSVEMVPGASQPVVWHITDEDLIVGSTVTASDFRSITDDAWCNLVAPKYVEPSQQYKDHSAPIRVVQADVIADGGQRVDQPTLPLCTSGTQAQRVGEQRRRMGRLWRTRSLVLGPRLAGIEHGDWLSWTSNRYGIRAAAANDAVGIGLEDGTGDIAMEGRPMLFQVQTDGQDEKWQNSIQLREISFDVFDWNAATDELADGAVAVQSSDPVFGSAPDADAWSLTAITETGNGNTTAALLFTGTCEDDQADAIIFEYAAGASAPDANDDDAWTVGSTTPNTSTSRAEVTGVMAGTIYWGAVSYRVAGVQGDRLLLGPVTTAAAGGADGRITSESGDILRGEDGSQIIKE